MMKKLLSVACLLMGMWIDAHPAAAISPEDLKTVRRLEKVSETMLTQLGRTYGHHDTSYPFHVRFLDDDIVNAYSDFYQGECWVYVYTGLWDKDWGLIQRSSDDEFAAALGHEMGHCLAQHQELMKKSVRQMIEEMKAAKKSGKNAGSVNPYLEILAISRDHENEADFLGMELMKSAGYNPWAAVDMWQRAASRPSEGKMPDYYRAHPSAAERANRIRQALEAEGIPRN